MDDAWFAQLYEASYRRLVVIALSLTSDVVEAEEVVQEAFVRAYARQSRLRTVHNPEAWICTVALNVARRRHRRHTIVLRSLLRRSVDPTQAASPEDATVVDDELMTAIAALPVEQREAVLLHYLADLPVGEVAVRTGVAEGTVKSRLARARAGLQRALRDGRSFGVTDAALLQEAEDHG